MARRLVDAGGACDARSVCGAGGGAGGGVEGRAAGAPGAGASLALVEALYAPPASELAWLDALAERGRASLDQGLGVVAYSFHVEPARPSRESLPARPDEGARGARRGRWALGELAARGASPRALAAFFAATKLARQPELRAIYLDTAPTSALSEFTGVARLERSRVARAYGARLSGVADFLAIKGVDEAGGAVLGVFLPTLAEHAGVLAASARDEWDRVAAHLGAAHRLLRERGRRPDGLPQGAEAVLDPGGAVLHAEGEARGLCAELGDAARRIDRARARRGDDALELWPALCEARWSLVDHFESGGRRYVVARRNEASTATGGALGPGLSARERAVVALAARGRPHKLIAYELGLAEPTVRTYERRAMEKLGLASRAELVRLFAGLT